MVWILVRVLPIFIPPCGQFQFVQKKDPNYKEVKEDTAWTMEKFNDYINKNYAADKGIEEDWTFNTLTVS